MYLMNKWKQKLPCSAPVRHGGTSPVRVVGFGGKGNQGASYYTAPNPEFGATFTYYLKDGLTTLVEQRKKKEKDMKGDISFPGWAALDTEATQQKPKIWLTVKDTDGNTVRRIEGKTERGFHRTVWDLRYPSPEVIRLDDPTSAQADRSGNTAGFMASPGTYTVTLSKEVDGMETQLSYSQPFKVVPLRKGALQGPSPDAASAFWREIEDFQREFSSFSRSIVNARKKANALQVAVNRVRSISSAELVGKMYEIQMGLNELEYQLNGSKAKMPVGEKRKPSINERLGFLTTSQSTYGATGAQRRSLEIVKADLGAARKSMEGVMSMMESIGGELEQVGAPKVEGN